MQRPSVPACQLPIFHLPVFLPWPGIRTTFSVTHLHVKHLRPWQTRAAAQRGRRGNRIEGLFSDSGIGAVRTDRSASAHPQAPKPATTAPTRDGLLLQVWRRPFRGREWLRSIPLDYSAISRRIWKKWSKQALAIPITWQPFPNNEAALAEDKSRKSEAMAARVPTKKRQG
jgi:hypothetical protein